MAARGLRMIPTNPGWVYLRRRAAQRPRSTRHRLRRRPTLVYEQFTGGIDLANIDPDVVAHPVATRCSTACRAPSCRRRPRAVNLARRAPDGSQVVTLSSPMPVCRWHDDHAVRHDQGPDPSSTPPTVIDTPSVAELLNDTRTQFAFWHDFNQTAVGSGRSSMRRSRASHVTWNGVTASRQRRRPRSSSS